MKEYIIRRLKEARTNKGLTQFDVASRLGIKKNTISNYEKGVTSPDMDSFIALCEIYELDFAEILSIAYSYTPKKAEFMFAPNEKQLIEDYRQLDRIGQEAVDFVMKHQLDRMAEFKRLLQIYGEAERERECNAADQAGPHPYRGPHEELIREIAEQDTKEALDKLAEDVRKHEASRIRDQEK